MAKLDEYWNQITQSESFQDLEPEKKEKVRRHLFDQYVQKTASYQALDLTQRNQVLKHFNDTTNIKPESMGQDLMRRGKKMAKAAEPIVKKVGEVASDLVDVSKVGSDIEDMASTGVEIPGMKKAAAVVSGATEKVATAIEPNFVQPKLTEFDIARAIGAGAVRTMGDFLSGLIPETTVGASAYFAEPVLKFAGTTFLGKELHMPSWKPKTGLRTPTPTNPESWGDAFENIVTRRRIENNGRMMTDGPPKPLEVLANKEQALKAKDEFQQYQSWLQEADKISPSGGEPTGDLYPEAKVNVTQLRDMAKERLQKLQDEPVRVESVSRAEDELHGYYRRKADQMRVYMMPDKTPLEVMKPGSKTGNPHALFAYNDEFGPGGSKRSIYNVFGDPEHPSIKKRGWGSSVTKEDLDKSGIPIVGREPRSVSFEPIVPRETQALLPEGPKPAGLLKEPPKTSLERPNAPTPKTPTPPSAPSPAAPIESSVTSRAKDVLTKAYSAYYPGQTKQAIGVRVGAMMKAFGFKANDELNFDHMTMLERFIEQEHSEYLAKEAKGKAKTVDISRLKEKGMDPLEVKVEAKRLQDEHELMRQGNLEAKRRIKEVTGGIGFHDPDPITGMVPEKEEVLRNVPLDMRGQTKPDQAAQMAYDAGIIKGPSSNDLYQHMKELQAGGKPRSVSSFLEEAEYRLENQNHQQAGFKPEPTQESIPGTPPAGMPPTALSQPQGQVPADRLMEGFDNQDIQNQSTFDIVSGLYKNLGEKGQIGGGDIDPVRQAAMEAGIKELVDRAMALGYQTTQDIMLYAARNAPKEIQDALRKNLAPTLSAFDTHAYKEMEAAKQGNPIAKKSMMDAAQRGYFQDKLDIVKGKYRKFKANQQILVFKDGYEGLMRMKNDLFIHDNYRKFTKDELAAQRWYTEGKSPKLESLTALGVKEDTAKRWLSLAKNPTENMKNARAATQVFEDEYHDVLSEFYDRVGYREDHVTRRWKRPEEYMDWEGRALGNRPNFLKGAKLLSQAQGIDAGLEPMTFDIREDLRASNNARVNILSRIHAYQKMGASFGPDGMPAIIDESTDAVAQARNAKITPHTGEAPPSWIRTNDVPLLRGLAINPYYKPAMKFMMARPFQGTVPEVLDFLAASTKASKLYGLFHAYTLGEMLFSGVSYRDVFSFSKDRNVMFRGLRYTAKAMTADMEGKPLSKNPAKAVGELYNSFITGHGALANRPLALEMAEHGFKFGSADEDMHGILKKYLTKTENYLTKRIGEGAAKGLTALPRAAVDIQEKALWSYIRPISSMLVYETNIKDAILKFNLEAAEGEKIPVDKIKEMIVNQTSKEMGGISYARLMINPRTQQVLQWAMLAPGWTIGRALMGASMFEKGPEGRQARKQMAKLFVGWFFASNMINYAQTKQHLGKGRYMWENPEGYRNQAFLSKEKDGSTRYLQLSKALTEIYDDVMEPKRTLAYKVSPTIQAAVKVMNWGTAKAYYPGIEPENPLMAVAHAYEPMISSGNSAYGGLPVKRGPSTNKIKGMLDEYYKGGMKNSALFQEAMQTATEQGYDASKLDRAVRANRTHKERQALFK